MRVNVIIPVFNRLEHTRKVLEALRRQTIFDALTIVIVNDGSTDGTAGYLQSQSDVIEIRGDGNLWWGAPSRKDSNMCFRPASRTTMSCC